MFRILAEIDLKDDNTAPTAGHIAASDKETPIFAKCHIRAHFVPPFLGGGVGYNLW